MNVFADSLESKDECADSSDLDISRSRDIDEFNVGESKKTNIDISELHMFAHGREQKCRFPIISMPNL